MRINSRLWLVFSLALPFAMSGCALGHKQVSRDASNEDDNFSFVVFKSPHNGFVIEVGEGTPEKDVISQKSAFSGSFSRATVIDGFGVQKVKSNSTYFIRYYMQLVAGRLESSYPVCGGRNTIYFKTRPRTTHYISEINRHYENGKLIVGHSKGNFDSIKKNLEERFPNLASRLVSEPFYKAAAVTACDLPSPIVVPIFIPQKKK